jgi:hypothetical protein
MRCLARNQVLKWTTPVVKKWYKNIQGALSRTHQDDFMQRLNVQHGQEFNNSRAIQSKKTMFL